jgi:hypothetical protein
MRYILALLLVTFGLHVSNAHGAQQSADFPVGTVITVTDDGVTVVYDDGASSGSTGGSGSSTASTDPGDPDPYAYGYCTGNDDSVADCRTDGVFDPWIASAGEKELYIEDKKTETFAFLLPSRYDSDSQADITRYGYLQFTSPEPQRDPVTQDVFRAWWSVEPNGEPLAGGGCEWLAVRARGYMYWTQDPDLVGDSVCNLGTDERVMYLNFETRCVPSRYDGFCDADTPQKSSRSYQFDVARYVKGY